ncbi:MAG: sulfite exporter TauE/SafE family protein [Myxococcota bacterium]
MELAEIFGLVVGGLLAGVVNTLAGGGSLVTVPLLILLGLPGGVANGTNRVGILVQSLMAIGSFRAHGISEFRSATPILIPVLMGSALGAAAITRTSDETFERLFAVLMLALLIPTLRRTSATAPVARTWSPLTRMAVFFAIGIYGGAFQAGVGIILLIALSHAGIDLVRANAMKMLVVGALTAVAIPVFVIGDQIAWLPAAVLAGGYAIGGAAGARLAVHGGEALIRPVLGIAVVVMAGSLLGLF